ncbi:lysine--tRNA ligase [Patescibacteria group bacterium]|nr:lysine--tRNA ligase [Patescibacteria group bacterium]MBP9709942.1 lysine--tRNA ligase [Patescibacteria group bacterium]
MLLDEFQVRQEKLTKLQALGLDPYAVTVQRTHVIGDALVQFEEFAAESKVVILAGRVLTIRVHGGMMFADVADESGKIQFTFKQDDIGEDIFARFRDLIDPSDIVEATGVLFVTKRGEKSLSVQSWRVLSKALRPLPEKWHGLQDVEARYRHREVDLIINPETRKRLVARSRMVSALRRYLDERGFMEVETPILQAIPGGANARPFITHHNSLDVDLYLRIAPELFLKRLVVGGFEKIYEIGRSFRNEGIDYAHNPEFTMMELYWAFCPSKDVFVTFLEEIMRHMIQGAVGALRVPYEDHEIDFSAEWPRVTFRQSIIDACGIDIDLHRDELSLKQAVKEKKVKVDFKNAVGIGEHYDELYKKTARAAFRQPTWVLDYPVDLKPLAGSCEYDATKSASVQLVVEGAEIINAYYHELTNPLDQRRRFEAQEALREKGSHEAQHLDEDFLSALEQGMPPTSGVGIGIDRLIAFLTNAPNLKEVIAFPTLRPKKNSEEQE